VLVCLLLAAAAADPFGFSQGTEPVDLSSDPDKSMWTSAEECADCHEDVVAQWTTSRHRVAWTNDLMQAGFVAEPRMFCVHCHAPAAEQVAEIRRNLATYAALGPHAPPHIAPAPLAPEPMAEEGISCVVCHLRDGQMLSADAAHPDSPHEVRVDPAFGSSAACTTCHDFPTPAFIDGTTHISDEPMQATAQEWEAWKSLTGRTEDCPACHMPEGDHSMHGAHDRDRLTQSIVVTQAGSRLTLSTRDVGHAVPTGDLFRHLTVEARATGDPTWTTLDTLGRTFAVDASTVPPTKRQTADSRLHPGAPRVIELPERFLGGRWRLRYHYGGPHDEARGLVPSEQLVAVVHQGSLPPPPTVTE